MFVVEENEIETRNKKLNSRAFEKIVFVIYFDNDNSLISTEKNIVLFTFLFSGVHHLNIF